MKNKILKSILKALLGAKHIAVIAGCIVAGLEGLKGSSQSKQLEAVQSSKDLWYDIFDLDKKETNRIVKKHNIQ